jgi:hypothetical protein
MTMKKVWDQMGITVSSLCFVHCVLVAFVPLMVPTLSFYPHASWPHIITGALVFLTTPLAFIPGYKKHGFNWVLILALIGLVLVVSGIFLENLEFSEQESHGVSILGSLLLVFSHLKNLQHSHKHNHQCC